MNAGNAKGRQIALFDVHVPKHSDLRDVLKFVAERPVEHLILGGDFVNGTYVSHWSDPVFAEIGRQRQKEMVLEELDEAVKVIKEIKRAAGKAKIWYIIGNHEMWYWHCIFNYRLFPLPFTTADFNFKSDIDAMANTGIAKLFTTFLDAKRLGMTVVPYKEPLKLGPLVYVHGDQFGGQDPTASSSRKWPSTNLVFGHHHVHSVRTLYNSGDPKQVHQHTAVPPLCQFNPGYLMDPSTRWLHGFWVADFDKRGYFDGRVVKVFDGKIIRG